jgi:lysophospholipase L1-like esterase
MRKLLSILVMCLPSFFASGQGMVYDTIRYAREHYQKRVSVFQNESIVQGSVIFLGNSITEFGDWRNLLRNFRVINRGVAGDNTFGVLDRLEDVIIRKPRKLFIEIGINDVSQNIPETIILKNIFDIVTSVSKKLPETKIYIHSILPTNDNVKNEYPDAFHKNAVVNSVNKQLEQNATKYKFVYIDLSTELSDKHGDLNVKYADPDGLHLNEAGYRTWIALLKKKKYL